MRPVPGSINIAPASFPLPAKAAKSNNPSEIAASFVLSFNDALKSKALLELSLLFLDSGFWRDHLALTWELRTLQGPPRIYDFLKGAATSRDGFRLQNISVDASNVVRAPKFAPVDADGEVIGVQFFLNIDTVHGTGQGLVRLVEEAGNWKVFTLYTRLEELKGHEQHIFDRRPVGAEHGGKPGRSNWADKRAEALDYADGSEPAVLVVGGGQAGLTAAARLKTMGVNTLIIDQNASVGDNWRKRYHQLVLHDPVWYDHLPYLNFPPQWPIFTPKDKLAQFFESYATLLELNVWTSTELVDTKWNKEEQHWTVVVNRTKADGTSETRTFKPRHIIQATGHSGKKNMPSMTGIKNFAGDRLCHSSEFPGAQSNSQGKKAIVVGSCNSAHDIAQDYLEKGYDITMVQRSTTHVVSSKAITDVGLKGLFSEHGPQVDEADILLHGLPTPVLKALQVKVCALQAEHDKDMLAGLTKAGFKVDSGPDGAGLFIKYFQRGGGYYINVGASELIASGQIKVKQGQEIEAVLPHGLRFADGSELEADEIVFATGYQNMRTQTRSIFGEEVADKVGDVWGFNEEGEMRTIWQRSGHPGFWFHGGNLAMCRYYSRLLALQIKGLVEGLYEVDEL
ncbi:hypothetical protein MBLNU13_g05053t1 [Cladosporium sp. NU13]